MHLLGRETRVTLARDKVGILAPRNDIYIIYIYYIDSRKISKNDQKFGHFGMKKSERLKRP